MANSHCFQFTTITLLMTLIASPLAGQGSEAPGRFSAIFLETVPSGETSPDAAAKLAVQWTGDPAAQMSVWVDFDGDGEWAESEQVVDGAPLAEGIVMLDVGVGLPAGLEILPGLRARFRVFGDGEMPREIVQWIGEERRAGPSLPPVAPSKGTENCEWASGFHLQGMSEEVRASVVFDDGGGPALYVGGMFTSVDDVVTNRIAKWDGTQWAPLGTGMNGTVYALTVHDDGSGPALYAGGTFTTASGVNAGSIAKWDGTQWTPLGTGMNGTVYALTVHDDGSGPALYAGGNFTTAGGVSATRIAKWDGTQWAPLGIGMNRTVYALTVHDDGSGPALYAAGFFFIAGGVSASSIAKWDGTQWAPLGTGMNSTVRALTAHDDGSGPALYAAGFFTTAGGVSATSIAKWDGTQWTPLGTGMNGSVNALTVHDDGSGLALYAGGNFTTAGGVNASSIAKWNGTEWAPLSTGMNGSVNALTVHDDGSGPVLYASGNFAFSGGVSVNRIARWDGVDWTMPAGVPGGNGLNSFVYSLALYDDGSGPALYAAGDSTNAGGVSADHIAKWNGTQWTSLGTGMNNSVRALAVFNDGSGPALFAAGEFTTADGVSANRIAKWNGTQWAPLDAGISNTVRALAVFDDGSGPALYAAGEFTTAGGGVGANYIAKWDGTQWTPLGAGMNDRVWALAVFDDGSGPALYAAGDFTAAGGADASYIAKWDGTQWTPLGTGMNNFVVALTVFDDGNGLALYAGGTFTTAGGSGASKIAKWDGTQWTSLGTGMNSTIIALKVFDDGNGPALYAGGSFTTAGEAGANYIAKWDGTQWTPLGTGMSHEVRALTVFDAGSGPALYAGGHFATAGGSVSNRIAKWTCPKTPSTDLAVTKTNSTDQSVAGATTTYTITATNLTHIDTPLATLTDTFPTELSCSWTSTTSGSASGNTAGSGSALEETLSLPAGSSIIYTIACQLDPAATEGQLVNTATIFTTGDIDTENNTATDTDTIIQESDIAVTLTNGSEEIVTGSAIYSLSVTNNGPSNADTVTLNDTFPAELTSCRWQSTASAGAIGNTAGAGTVLNETLTIPAGGAVHYAISCAVNGAAGIAVDHTATITSPTDSNPANNTATDTDTITPPPATVKTLILTNMPRLLAATQPTADELADLLTRLNTFAAHTNVDGLILDVGYAADIADLYATWDADVAIGGNNPGLANYLLFGCHGEDLPSGCTSEKDGIHDLVLQKLEDHNATSLMLLGDDRIIPMARVPDFTSGDSREINYTPLGVLAPGLTATNTTVGQALAKNRYLSDDPIAQRSAVDIANLEGFEAFEALFLPQLAVGRLVETPAEILQSLDVFLAQDGLLDLTALDPDHRVLVTGYDFLVDSAKRIRRRWKSAFGEPEPHDAADLMPVDGQLVSRTWSPPLDPGPTVDERRTALWEHLSGQSLGRYGIMNLNGHATHYEEGVPGQTQTAIQGLSTADLDTLDLTGSVVYAVGCHGGLPVAGENATAADHPLDLPQVYLRRGVQGHIANSGFGWGLRHGVGYSERMVEILTEELSQGDDIVLGEAILATKMRYHIENFHFDPYDIKTSMQWTLFGFPMYTLRTGLAAPAYDPNDEIIGLAEDRPHDPVVGGGEPEYLISEPDQLNFIGTELFKKYNASGEEIIDFEGCPTPSGADPPGCYYTLLGLATGEGDLPIAPYFVKDSRLAGTSQHGVLWKGGTYEEEGNWTPVFAQLISNGGPIDLPSSLPISTSPRPRNNKPPGSALGSQDCRATDPAINRVIFSPAELILDADLQPDRHRLHRQVDLEYLYYNNKDTGEGNCDRLGPELGESFHSVQGAHIHWSVAADDEGGVWRVLVVYDDESNSRWVPFELEYNASNERWEGQLLFPPNLDELTYFLQAVDLRGNVSWAEYVPPVPAPSGIDSRLPQAITVEAPEILFADGFESASCAQWSSGPGC